jgi:hypothetical protein
MNVSSLVNPVANLALGTACRTNSRSTLSSGIQPKSEKLLKKTVSRLSRNLKLRSNDNLVTPEGRENQAGHSVSVCPAIQPLQNYI